MSTSIKCCIGIFISLLMLFCICAFSNPQLNKWFYVFQAYYSPFGPKNSSVLPSALDIEYILKHRHWMAIPWPESYSGIYCHWDRKGNLLVQVEFKDGQPINEATYYHAGKRSNKCIFKSDGSKVVTMYDDNGDVDAIYSRFKNGNFIRVYDSIFDIDRRKEFGIEITEPN